MQFYKKSQKQRDYLALVHYLKWKSTNMC